VYRDETAGGLNQHSIILTTVHGDTIAAWSPSFYPGESKPLFTVRGIRVLSQANEEILYRPTTKTVALAFFEPSSFPLYQPVNPIGPMWKETPIHRAADGAAEYRVGHRWVGYNEGDGSLTVAGTVYRVRSFGGVVANPRRLWLITAHGVWEVAPSGPPRKISWPPGLGPVHGIRGVEVGTTLYAAVSQEIPGSVAVHSQLSPLVHAWLVKVSGRHASILREYPTVEGAVTSFAAGPHHMLYLAFYTGHHNVVYLDNLAGKGILAGYSLAARRWDTVAIPEALYRPSYEHSLLGESPIHLVVLPGPHFYFLVQSDPMGTGMGIGGFVWALYRGRVHYYDVLGGSLEVLYRLTEAPGGQGVLVNAGNVLALVSPSGGLGYLGEPGLSATEWLRGTRFLSEVSNAHGTTVYEVTASLRPRFLLRQTVAWP
jgi:hypothetical protein